MITIALPRITGKRSRSFQLVSHWNNKDGGDGYIAQTKMNLGPEHWSPEALIS